MSQLFYHPMHNADELIGFQCGIKEMDDFITNGLSDSIVANHCEAYVVHNSIGEVVGFFALRDDTLVLVEEDKDDMRGGFSNTSRPKFHVREFLLN